MRYMASDVAHAVGGTLSGRNAHLSGASFDSRTLRDGHDFVADALARGAGAYLTAREPVGRTAIRVPDTLAALLALGRWARTRLEAPLRGRVVGITGSVGKTGTKDLVAAALGAGLRVHASRRSFNNDQGLPTTILEAPDDAEALVLEMGMRGLGEIARLCAVGAPRVGIVTRIGSAHSARVGGIEGVARAKGELVEALPADGVAVLNADDERVAAMAASTGARVLTFSAAGRAGADVRAEEITVGPDLCPSFVLCRGDERTPVRLGVRGEHNVANALAAATAAFALGVSPDEVAAGLAAPELSPWRMELDRSPAGALVLNDAYNANPTSMVAALRALAALDARRRFAVLGHMAELGADEAAEHRRVGAFAVELGIELVAVRTDLYGVDPVASTDEVLDVLGTVGEGDAVLVKASRSAGLEQVAAALLER